MSEEVTTTLDDPGDVAEPTEPTAQTPAEPAAAQAGQDPAWLPDRLRRAADAESKRLLQEIGVASLDEAKALKAAKDEADQAQMTAHQKAEAQRDAEKQRADAAEAKLSAMVRENGFRDAWAKAGKSAEHLPAALKLVEWPDGEADFAALVAETIKAYPVLDPEPIKPDTGSSAGRGAGGKSGPNPLHEKWNGMLGVPVGDK